MHVSLQLLKRKQHIFILLSSWKTNPYLSEREACDCVVCEFPRVICRWEGVASFVTSQGQLDVNDVACNTLCVRVKLCSHSEENQIVPILRRLASTVCCEASVYWDSARKGLLCKPRIPPSSHLLHKKTSSSQAPNGKCEKIYLVLSRFWTSRL